MLDRLLLLALPLAATLLAHDLFAQTPPVSAPPEAVTSANGIASIVLAEAPADARLPRVDDHVTLDYTTWTADGRIIDSTAKHPDVRTFALNKLSTGLQESLSTMKRGEKRRIWIPPALGPKKMAVVIDVQLVAAALTAMNALSRSIASTNLVLMSSHRIVVTRSARHPFATNH